MEARRLSKNLATSICARADKARLLHGPVRAERAGLLAARLRLSTPIGLTRSGNSFGMRNQKTAALIAYRAFSDVAGKGAFLAVTVLAARRLSGEEFGVFALGTTLGWMVAVGTDFGIQAHLGREVARRPTDARPLLERWLHVRRHTAVVGFGIATVAIGVMDADTSFVPALLVLVAFYVVAGLVEFVHYFYRGISRTDLESSVTLSWRAGMLACAVAALLWRPDVMTLAIALLLPAAAAFLLSLRQARAIAPAHATHPDENLDAWGELTREVMPIGAGVLLSALYFRVDVLLIEWWQGTAAVGHYGAVFRLVDALRLFPAAVLAVALPALCRASSARLVLQLSAALTAGAAGLSLVLWLFADPLVPLVYGAAYADAVPAFRILLWSFPVMSLNYVLTQQLIGWNGHRAYALTCALALAVNLSLNVRLIPALSIAGAAWATVWTELAVTVGCGVALWINRSRPRESELRMRTAS